MANGDIRFKIQLLADDQASRLFKSLEKQAAEIAKLARNISKNLSGIPRVARNISRGFSRLGQLLQPAVRAANKLLGPFRQLPRLVSATSRALRPLNVQFSGLAIVAGAAAAAYTATQVIEASSRQQDALNAVATSLRRVGEGSRENLQEVAEFASELQNLTGVGDEATLEMFALAQSFGASKDQAKEITTAAIELSAATGKSLQEATAQVSKTLGGFAGELGEVNPAIKALTAEQLKAGEAARILIDQYGGTAASRLQTFSGSVEGLSGRFGDFLETVGDLITKNPVVVKLVGRLAKAFQNLGTFFTENRVELTQFVNNSILLALQAFQKLNQALGGLLITLGLISEGLLLIGSGVGEVIIAFSEFTIVQEILKNVELGLLALGDSLLELVDFILGSGLGGAVFETLGGNVDDAKNAVEEFRQKIQETAADVDGSELGSAGEKIKENFDEAKESVNDFVNTAVQKLSEIDENIGEIVLDVKSVNTPEAIEAAGGIFGDVEDTTTDKKTGEKLDRDSSKLFTNQAGEIANGISRGILQGARGAAEVVTSAIAVGIDAAFPGAGQFAKPILDLLALGPEAAKEQIKSFVTAIPDIIIAIAEALPAVIEGLAEALPDAIVAIVSNLDIIIGALLRASLELARAAFTIVIDVVEGLVQEVFGSSLSFSEEKIKNILTAAFNNIANFLTNVFGGFDPLFQNIGNFFENIVNSVADGFNTIFSGSAESFTRAIENAGNFLQESVNKITDGLTDVVNVFRDVFRNIGNFFKENITDPLNDFLDRLSGADPTKNLGKGFLGTGIGGKEGFVSDDVPIIGGLFAQGGQVPNGFPNDTFPARLTSGELVIPRGDTDRLSSFLDNQEGNTNTEALLAQIVTLLSEPQQVVARAEVNQEALAEIILDLNRQNQRLA